MTKNKSDILFEQVAFGKGRGNNPHLSGMAAECFYNSILEASIKFDQEIDKEDTREALFLLKDFLNDEECFEEILELTSR